MEKEYQNDRKAAVKKLKLLAYNGKNDVEAFRKKMDAAFSTVFLPNGVERSDYKYGNISCEVLSPEIYASNRVMLYLHGGSFVGGSPATYRSFCASLATKCFCRVVVPDYRLAPNSPYPAANEDIQSVFRALYTEEQIACSLNAEKGTAAAQSEIIIAADGSAASLACSLIFNLRDRYRANIKKVILFSPWLDISNSSTLCTSKKLNDEIFTPDVFKKCSSVYTFESNGQNPYVSPLYATKEDLVNFPPLIIQMGAKEVLLENARAFTDKVREAGSQCQLDVWPDMMFMFQMADEYLHESHLALDKIGKFITGGSDLQRQKFENKPKLERGLNSEA
ncbi:MAG: alpha/beta hydrolase fold domain-containing protein [Treponema sp.]|nr:alpha/beta hydrolase fold domain-containing protein [Treponema sp.]